MFAESQADHGLEIDDETLGALLARDVRENIKKVGQLFPKKSS